MIDAEKVTREYSRLNKPPRGIKTFAEAQEYSDKAGRTLAKALGNGFEDMDEDEIASLLKAVLKRPFRDSAAATALAQKAQIDAAGLGINALTAEYDEAKALALAQELFGREVSMEFVENLLSRETLRAFDETIRINAEANGDMGLQTHITRTYGDVGLRAGTPYAEDCQWCLSRCGEWFSYLEAYYAGVFERHPGCACEIEYKVGKTHTRSTRGGNNWNFTDV